MRKHLGSRKTRSVLSLLILAIGLSIVVSACGSSNKSNTTSGGGGGGGSSTSSQAADVTKCGTKPGVKATGTPIKLGAIVTKQPGTDFTGITGMAQAYCNCVNFTTPNIAAVNMGPYYSSTGAASTSRALAQNR